MMTKHQTRLIHDWVSLDYEVKVEHLRRIARHIGYDRGWAERNVQNIENIIKKLPNNRELSEKDIDIKAAFLPPPDQT